MQHGGHIGNAQMKDLPWQPEHAPHPEGIGARDRWPTVYLDRGTGLTTVLQYRPCLPMEHPWFHPANSIFRNSSH